MKDADKIKKDFKPQPRKLNYLWAIIADLFSDVAKVKGVHSVQNKLGKLKQVLNNYTLEDL